MSKKELAADHYSNYAEYNKLLRTWFVTFDWVAQPSFFSKPELLQALSTTQRWQVVGAFLLGCGFQVGLALVNKIASWGCYASAFASENDTPLLFPRCAAVCEWLHRQYWIDAAFDLLTFGMFAWATYALAAATLPAG